MSLENNNKNLIARLEQLETILGEGRTLLANEVSQFHRGIRHISTYDDKSIVLDSKYTGHTVASPPSPRSRSHNKTFFNYS